jgi:hypothetical protein
VNLQPHVIVLHWIRSELKKLSVNPNYLNFCLGGYCYSPSMQNIYGAKFIDKAAEWLRVNEKHFNYNLGYRLDSSKLPNVTVMFSGGTETTQVMGDDAGYFMSDIYPVKYAEFHASGITEEGYLSVSSDYHLEDKIWRGLVLQKKGILPRVITGLIKESEDADLKIITPENFSLVDGLDSWTVYSSASAKRVSMGGSFDRINIKVYMDIPGDPELAEVMSSVMRAALKNARLYLMQHGLNEVSLSYSPVGRNESYSGVNVWTTEFTISGKMTDRWIINESALPDQMNYEIECARGV